MIIDGYDPFNRQAASINEASHRFGLWLSALCALVASAFFILAFSLSIFEWYSVKSRLEADAASFRDAQARSVPWQKSKVSRTSKLTETYEAVGPDVKLEQHLQMSAVANARPAVSFYLGGLCLAAALYGLARAIGWLIARRLT